ncbi:hypothetical protein NG791_01090 [Laspinema sp. D1]|uniref:hypothetical protein n=1 Tax=Laspinema palackyanum TaxID=3231601 RepID=UPI00348B4831|nr:hypothetical protein [Laspinema sp. D2b]
MRYILWQWGGIQFVAIATPRSYAGQRFMHPFNYLYLMSPPKRYLDCLSTNSGYF